MRQICSKGIIPGLERIKNLLALMGNPEKDLKCVHITGTNGKGSTSMMIAGILKEAGYRVGCFTSPHIHSYRERISIKGEKIREADFLACLDGIKVKVQTMTEKGLSPPTEFEVLTAMALQYFADNEVDIAVLEVGMGGIYDSTNVVEPLVSVITGVDYDHTDFLGSTLEEIAANKAGIIKRGVPVVIGPMEAGVFRIIEEKAKKEKSPLYSSSSVRVTLKDNTDVRGQIVDIEYNRNKLDGVYLSLLGDFQLRNLTISLMALMLLEQKGYVVPGSAIRKALGTLKIPGRMEILCNSPLVFADVAHNAGAARTLAASFKNLLPGRQRVLVCGMLDDKEAGKLLELIGEDTRACIITRPEGQRGCHWGRLKNIWHDLFPKKEVYEEEDIKEAVKKGVNMLREREYMLITGSFYIMDKSRKYFLSV